MAAPEVSPQTTAQRGRPRLVRGVVVADTMQKTRLITLQRTVRHQLYHKSLQRQRRLFIHDEKNESKTGDLVLARETRPRSRHKHYVLVKVLGKKAGT